MLTFSYSKQFPHFVETNFYHRYRKSSPIVSNLRKTNRFHFSQLEFEYYTPTEFYFLQVNSFLYVSPAKPNRYATDWIASP